MVSSKLICSAVKVTKENIKKYGLKEKFLICPLRKYPINKYEDVMGVKSKLPR
jgi:hypothetical protein